METICSLPRLTNLNLEESALLPGQLTLLTKLTYLKEFLVSPYAILGKEPMRFSAEDFAALSQLPHLQCLSIGGRISTPLREEKNSDNRSLVSSLGCLPEDFALLSRLTSLTEIQVPEVLLKPESACYLTGFAHLRKMYVNSIIEIRRTQERGEVKRRGEKRTKRREEKRKEREENR